MFQGGINQIFVGTEQEHKQKDGYHSTKKSLYKLKWRKLNILTNKNVIKIACQKDVALFLDSRGIVWSQYDEQEPTSMK